MKISTPKIAFCGISATIIGYLLATDWQTIPYDPCTEFSPFHHPSQFQNIDPSLPPVRSATDRINLTNVPQTLTLNIHLEAMLNFADDQMVEVDFPGSEIGYKCKVTSNCKVCEDSITPCVSLVLTNPNNQDNMMQSFLCSHYSTHDDICVTSIHNSQLSDENHIESVADIQRLLVLPTDVYFVVSNACINANVSVGACQWIPFASGEKCEDCPPICRAKQRTLLLPLYLIGMILVLGTYQIVWVSIVAMATNQSSESIQVSSIASYYVYV